MHNIEPVKVDFIEGPEAFERMKAAMKVIVSVPKSAVQKAENRSAAKAKKARAAHSPSVSSSRDSGE